MTEAEWGFSTRAIHSGGQPRPAGEVSPALQLSTTYARDEQGALPGPHQYARLSNPNRSALEATLTALESGAAAALTFSSGLAAVDALLRDLRPGERVVAESGAYFGVVKLLQHAATCGVSVEFADLCDPAAAEAALNRPAALVWCETPTNPMLRVADIARIAQLSRACGAALVVDSTIATPLLQAPLRLGADIVLHAATKALGGHSDLTLGALLFASAQGRWHDAAVAQRDRAGAVPSPFDCWLLQRGLTTVALRIRAQEANAAAVAAALSAHRAVEAVLWPKLPTHPQVTIAARQMCGGGSIVSVLLRGGDAAAAAFMGRLRLFARATSFGGVHSLAEHRWRVEGPETRTPRNLVRLALGVEDSADLLADLTQALDAER